MGSFASTCCVSGLPIEGGDPVRYLMLTKNPYHNGSENSCYIHDLWFPRVFPIRAAYNEYGSIEDVVKEDQWMMDLWLDGLRLDLVERRRGENPCHDVPTNKKMTFEELIEALWEGRVLVNREVPQELTKITKSAKSLPVGHGMIREDVWQSLLALETEHGPIRKYRSEVRRLYAAIMAEAREDGKAAKQFASIEGGDEAIRMLSESRIERCCRQYKVGWIFKNVVPFTVGLETNIKLAMQKGPLPEPFLNLAAEFAFIHVVLSTCRYQWRTSTSAGPQCGEWHDHVRFTAAMLKVARANAKKMDEKVGEG